MITFESVSFTYPGAPRPALLEVDLHIPEGELALVVGPTGSGKTTLLRSVNGLVPRFTGGTLAGRITVAGRDTARVPVREMAEFVGFVPQDPATGFVTATVEEELAYTMEQLGLAVPVMRRRTEEILDLLGLAAIRRRPLGHLSAGEAQRVALGAVLTAHPPVMVLDEPTSALDPTAAEEVLAAITRIVHDLGTTVLMAEHRLERVVQYADSIVHLSPDGRVGWGEPATVMATAPVAPPVVKLGRLAGWSPLPLSIRDARRRAGELPPLTPPVRPAPPAATTVAEVRDLSVAYEGAPALRRVGFSLRQGEWWR
jgi:energy-coupling factor transport system ATP-binding protein